MEQLTLIHGKRGLEIKAEDDKIALVERYGPSYKVIILTFEEALQVAKFIYQRRWDHAKH